MRWHHRLIDVLAAMPDTWQAGEGASLDFWLLKVMAVLIGLHISSADTNMVFSAEQSVLPSEASWDGLTDRGFLHCLTCSATAVDVEPEVLKRP